MVPGAEKSSTKAELLISVTHKDAWEGTPLRWNSHLWVLLLFPRGPPNIARGASLSIFHDFLMKGINASARGSKSGRFSSWVAPAAYHSSSMPDFANDNT